MGNLNLTKEEIKKLISLTDEYWEDDGFINCYAFALGLGISEDEIIKNAYQLGVMWATINDIPITELKKMTFEQRLLLDLETLKISCEEVEPNECSDDEDYYYDENGKIIAYDIAWLIALFSNGKDFHFLRKNYSGLWWHKYGYFGMPINYDSEKKKITNPKECTLINGYKYIKTYKLKYKEETIKI